ARGVDHDGLLLWVDEPDEAHAGREIVVQLELDFPCRVSLADDLHGEVRGDVDDRIVRHLIASESFPGDEAGVGEADAAGANANRAVGAERNAAFSLPGIAPKVAGQAAAEYRLLHAHDFLDENAVDQFV